MTRVCCREMLDMLAPKDVMVTEIAKGFDNQATKTEKVSPIRNTHAHTHAHGQTHTHKHRHTDTQTHAPVAVEKEFAKDGVGGQGAG